MTSCAEHTDGFSFCYKLLSLGKLIKSFFRKDTLEEQQRHSLEVANSTGAVANRSAQFSEMQNYFEQLRAGFLPKKMSGLKLLKELLRSPYYAWAKMLSFSRMFSSVHRFAVMMVLDCKFFLRHKIQKQCTWPKLRMSKGKTTELSLSRTQLIYKVVSGSSCGRTGN